MKKSLLMVSHPRSGSTFLMRSLQNKYNVRALYEIFHTYENIVLQHIEQGLGEVQKKALEDNVLMSYDGVQDFSRKKPILYLDTIKIFLEQEHLLYKIFPGHIKTEKNLEDLVLDSSAIVFLRRNVLHSYISNKVAEKVGTYANVDTSDIKIEFVKSEFVYWNNHIQDFFNKVEGIVASKNLSCCYLNYEEVVKNSDAYNLTMENIASHFGSIERFDKVSKLDLKKQDARLLAQHKVSNPESMLKQLSDMKLDYLDSSLNSVQNEWI